MRTISERVWNARQSWNFERTVITDDWTKIRVRIVRNAYDHQSFAEAQLWNGEGWVQVVCFPIACCLISRVSYVTPDGPRVRSAFAADAQRLLDEALAVLS